MEGDLDRPGLRILADQLPAQSLGRGRRGQSTEDAVSFGLIVDCHAVIPTVALVSRNNSVRPEPVEGLSFLLGSSKKERASTGSARTVVVCDFATNPNPAADAPERQSTPQARWL